MIPRLGKSIIVHLAVSTGIRARKATLPRERILAYRLITVLGLCIQNTSTLSLDFEGPARFDPDLGSAAAPAGALPPADAVGPPSTVMSGRDATLIGNQPQQLYDTIDASSLALIHDRQEVKHTNTTGTTNALHQFYCVLNANLFPSSLSDLTAR